jgi:hypothetical protein
MVIVDIPMIASSIIICIIMNYHHIPIILIIIHHYNHIPIKIFIDIPILTLR